MMIYFLIFTLFILTFFSGYFSASETALFSLSTTKIRTYQVSPDKRKQLIAELLSHPRDLLVTVFMLNTFVNVLVQNVTSGLFGEEASWALKVGVPFILLLLCGEIIPKYMGIQNNIAISYWVAPSIDFIQKLMGPLRRLTVAVTAPISRGMFFFLKKEESISQEELRHVLKQSKEHGVLTPDQAELVWGYLDLQDSSVKEIMRPRDEILYYDINDPLSKLTHLFVDLQCTRVPVCDKSMDHLLGIVTVKNFFLHRNTIKEPADLKSILFKPFYIPESTSALILLRRLEEKGYEIALVIDEYDSISGLITYEDLVEVVVGKIRDLRDQKSLYTRAGEHEIIASGKLELEEFNHLFNSHLESSHHLLTLGGWLTEQLDEIPKSGTQFEMHHFLFQILASDPNRIRRIYVRKLKGSPK